MSVTVFLVTTIINLLQNSKCSSEHTISVNTLVVRGSELIHYCLTSVVMENSYHASKLKLTANAYGSRNDKRIKLRDWVK